MDISAVITAHREGVMAGISLTSLLHACAEAERSGLTTEILVLLDRPDETTRNVFADAAERGWTVEEVAFGDQGRVRNRAIELCHGSFVAFLDADDLWSENWLVAAHEVCMIDPGHVVAHPELDWFFEANNNLFFHADSMAPGFDESLLRFVNYWDCLALTPREVHVRHPFSARAVNDGFAYEDWHWNCETTVAGVQHRVAPGTIHFKRRRPGSQTLEAAGKRCLPRQSDFFSYAWRRASPRAGRHPA
jgi:glycosyltransferase involved in cell wall biosynthesis